MRYHLLAHSGWCRARSGSPCGRPDKRFSNKPPRLVIDIHASGGLRPDRWCHRRRWIGEPGAIVPGHPATECVWTRNRYDPP